MRGLCRLTAGLLSLTRSTAYVLHPQEAVGRLRATAQDELTRNQAVPVQDDAVKPEVLHPDTISLEDILFEKNRKDEEQEDPVQAWLDDLSPPSTETISNPFITPTLIFSSLVSSTTESGPAVTASEHVPLASTRLNAPPSPTPLDWHPWSNQHQQPIGIGEAWKQAYSKAQSIVSAVASHITSCPSATKLPGVVVGTDSTPSSAVTARSVVILPTALAGQPPFQGTHAESSGASAVVIEPSALPAFDHKDDLAEKVDDTLPTTQPHIQPSPAHFTASSGGTLPIATSKPSVVNSQDAAHFITPSSGEAPGLDIPTNALPTDPKHLIAIIIPVVLTVVLSCAIFTFLIRRNPRARAERLARLEERRNQRLYRSAACKYKLQSWRQEVASRAPFSWFTKLPTEDLAEKGLLAPASGRLSGNRVSTEIRSFREAHDMVTTIVQPNGASWASRDRRRTALWLFGGRARRQRAMSNASSDLSDSEKTAPPPYDERSLDEKIDISTFIRSREDAQDSDKSSVSSIIPTSARNSTYTFSVDDPDSDKE